MCSSWRRDLTITILGVKGLIYMNMKKIESMLKRPHKLYSFNNYYFKIKDLID